MAKNPDTYGKLYLIPTLLGDNEPLGVLPLTVKQTVEQLTHFIVENERTARRFIKKITPRKSQPSLVLFPLNKYTEAAAIPEYLAPCLEGIPVGILSEAGCPAIADPGSEIVALAHARGIRVVPLVGPSSIFLALMASGLNGQNFAFNGYLPIETSERKKMLKLLEKRSGESGQSQFFMETPYRNEKLLAELVRTLRKDTLLCIAADLTLESEYIRTKPVADWADHIPDLNKRPAIFGIQSK